MTGEMADGTPFVGVDLIGVNPASARIPFAYAEVHPGVRQTKFFVADAGTGRVYRYDPDGQHEGSIGVGTKVANPRGIASNVAGDMLWVVDGKTLAVTVVQPGGKLRGTWKPAGLKQPEDIAVHDKVIWIVDAGNRRVYGYYGAATRTKGSAKISRSFALDAANTSPTGLVTDGQRFWVTDDAADRVFVYDMHGSLLGSWQLDPRNTDPSGITRNPAGGDDLWVVDRVDRLVYHYASGATLTDGQHPADATFTLYATNAQPEGIAAPPTSLDIPLDDKKMDDKKMGPSLVSADDPGEDFSVINFFVNQPSGLIASSATVQAEGEDSSTHQPHVVRADVVRRAAGDAVRRTGDPQRGPAPGGCRISRNLCRKWM